jgi:hypothetical protein
MTPEDRKLWKLVTDGISPLVFTSTVSPPVARPRPLMPPRGRFRPTLDLHGLTLAQAHNETRQFIYEAKVFYGLKYVRVITGLSGSIRREFPLWVAMLPQVRTIEPLNGGGAFKIVLTKR